MPPPCRVTSRRSSRWWRGSSRVFPCSGKDSEAEAAICSSSSRQACQTSCQHQWARGPGGAPHLRASTSQREGLSPLSVFSSFSKANAAHGDVVAAQLLAAAESAEQEALLLSAGPLVLPREQEDYMEGPLQRPTSLMGLTSALAAQKRKDKALSREQHPAAASAAAAAGSACNSDDDSFRTALGRRRRLPSLRQKTAVRALCFSSVYE
ncbi:hypothetical protein Efla_004820 [Eimeria flavescens]